MKSFIYLIAALMLVMTVIPVIAKPRELTPPSSIQTTSSGVDASEESPDTISVFKTASEKTETVDFFEYVCGSVAAEMPLSYHEEALKAQAVACYTNALRLKNGGGYKNNSHISDDSSVHQGYLSKEQRQEKWGDDFNKYESRLREIVEAVEGEALFFEDKLCVAAFFAISSGVTENAEVVWGEKIDYLTSVSSSGDKLSPNLTSTKSFSRSEAVKILGDMGIELKDTESLKNLIVVSEVSKAGTVLKAKINGKKVSGEDIRKGFSLRSAVFSVKCEKSKITFTVQGYGHGVGMSQYGADFSARQGSSYKEILRHYYKGAEIKKAVQGS